MNDQDIEREIQEKGLTAPRITPEHIESCIKRLEEMLSECREAITMALDTSMNNQALTREQEQQLYGLMKWLEDA